MNFLASESRKIQARGTGDNSMAGSFRSDFRGKSSGIMTKDSMLLGQKFVVKSAIKSTDVGIVVEPTSLEMPTDLRFDEQRG